MKLSLINDWRYLFSKDAIGGRFASFTPIMMAWLRTGLKDPDIDGFSVVLLGIGVRIRRSK